MTGPSLQERYAPRSTCFGCGPANEKGLRIRSFPREDGSVGVRFRARTEHEAFAGYLNGGIAGTLADCSMNWAATYALMRAKGLDRALPTVTLAYELRFQRPIPTAGEIELTSRVVDLGEDRATVEATIDAGGRTCATARGTFVAVKEGHPAYHRW
ncbi:MAG: PaaI family thioesterase [Chloroflexota bacterium]|nr:PaaI family thioesterase [Chloroflexota bacterium]MDE3192735.1 PaaI family thioesterase [Chloroflexota bacterium]